MIRHLPGILRYVVHTDSFLALSTLALLLSLLEGVGRLPGPLLHYATLLARVIRGTYFFLVARKAARGVKRLPIPSDYLDTWEELILPLVRAALATGWWWALALLHVHLCGGMVCFVDLHRAQIMSFMLQQGQAGKLLLGVGMVFLPPALLAALVVRRLVPLLNPARGLVLVWRLPRAWVVTFGLLCLLTLLDYALGTAGILIQSAMAIPLVAPLITHLLQLWVPLAQARLLGGFCWHNREWLGAQAITGGISPRR